MLSERALIMMKLSPTGKDPEPQREAVNPPETTIRGYFGWRADLWAILAQFRGDTGTVWGDTGTVWGDTGTL